MKNGDIEIGPDGRKWIYINGVFYHYDEEFEDYLDKYGFCHYIKNNKKEIYNKMKRNIGYFYENIKNWNN